MAVSIYFVSYRDTFTIMIKNHTPYLGKIYLKFEKDPYYTGNTKLNKVHLNLGFTKLVSRIRLVYIEWKYIIQVRVNRPEI